MFSRKHSNWFWFAKLLKFKHNNVRVKCFKKECKHCGTKKGVIGRKKWWIVTSLVIKWKKLWFVTSFVKKVWCAFPPFPRVILNTSWRAGRCPWKKKFIFKNYFFSLCHPQGTHDCLQQISAHSVQPFGRLYGKHMRKSCFII